MVFSGFPGGSVVKNSPATGVQSLIPEDQNAKDQLGPWATITETALWSLGAAITEACRPQSLCSTAPETTAMKSLYRNHCNEKPDREYQGQVVKNLQTNAGDSRQCYRLLGGKDPWEKEIATHSGILA